MILMVESTAKKLLAISKYSIPCALLVFQLACSTAKKSSNHFSKNSDPEEASSHYAHRGLASWYGKRFQNRKTASGERFNRFALTAAHRSLPFGSRVKVKNTN